MQKKQTQKSVNYKIYLHKVQGQNIFSDDRTDLFASTHM